MNNPIKSLRKKQGLTQQMLADKSGLSLRTIQRLEREDNSPKGHSLESLAKSFDLSTTDFKKLYTYAKPAKHSPKQILSLINLSGLCFLILPLSNIFIPFFIWRKNKTNPEVDEVGRKILNYQIIWTLCLFLSLSMTPFINLGLNISTPLILIVLFLGIAINLFCIFKTALHIQKEEYNFLNLPLKLI
ncbi:MAG: helix-turn-helix domain-containing protein [Bacteroidota bacterium]